MVRFWSVGRGAVAATPSMCHPQHTPNKVTTISHTAITVHGMDATGDPAAAPLTGLHSPRRIGRALRAARAATGLSQAEVAAEAGVSREAVSRLEGGRHVARADTLSAVLDVLGYEIAFLPRSRHAQQLRDRSRTAGGL
jgi:HTH-type transcriptional regulator/antitoxin HipB